MITVNNRDRVPFTPGMTVQNLLDKMGYSYSLITVTVEGTLVPKEEYDHFVLRDSSSVNVFHLAHGG